MPPKPPLVAPILLPTNTIQFAAIRPDGTAQDVINVLMKNGEVKEEVLGDLEAGYVDAGGWALQRVVKYDPGKPWEEDELERLQDGELGLVRTLVSTVFNSRYTDLGLLPMSQPMAPFLKSSTPSAPSLHRHFSAFPLTSHMHTPTLRLVSTHLALKLHLSFLRVPEIPDDFVLDWYISRNAAVGDVLQGVTDALGLAKSLGGAPVPYVLEEVVVGKNGKECEK